MEIAILFAIVAILVLLFIWPKPSDSTAIVSLVKEPHQFETWFRYHKDQMGIKKFYIFLDDENETIGVSDPSLILIQNWKDRLGFKWNDSTDEPTNRNEKQRLAFEEAQRMAAKDDIQWLVHIDSDELLYGDPPSRVFENSRADSFKIKNWEMAPDDFNYKNCFKEGKKFHTEHGKYIAYINGKSACRVGKGAWGGPHDLFSEFEYEIPEEDLKVLHYPSCNLSETMKRAKQYGNFENTEGRWSEHHKATRDVLASCSENCDQKALEQFKKRMADDASATLDVKFVS